MHIEKILIKVFMMIGLINSSFSAPPYQILQTCINNKPYNNEISITKLSNLGAADKPLDGCEDQYEFIFNGHTYGILTCNDKFYLIIHDKKIDPELVENMSINPEIQPGVEFTLRALWYKIDYENKAYLCIRAPLSEHGVGSAYNQYYISENAFDKNSNPELYFYFLDKDVVPITSKTL